MHFGCLFVERWALHKDRTRLKRKRSRVLSRIKNLVTEVHRKTADFLCHEYDVILFLHRSARRTRARRILPEAKDAR